MLLSICAATTQYQLSPFGQMKSFLLPSTPILPFPVVWHLRWYTLWGCLCRQFSMDMLLFDCTILCQRSAVWIYLCLMAQFCVNTCIMEGLIDGTLNYLVLMQPLWKFSWRRNQLFCRCSTYGKFDWWHTQLFCVNTGIMDTYGTLLYWCEHYGMSLDGASLSRRRHCREVD